MFLALAVAQFTACATNEELRRPATLAWSVNDPPGVEIIVHRDLRTVFEAATAAIHAQHLDIIERDEAQLSFVLAERTVTAWSWGEVVAIYLRAEEAEHTRVRVESRRRLATNITASDFTGPLIASIPVFAEQIAAARASDPQAPSPRGRETVVLPPVAITR